MTENVVFESVADVQKLTRGPSYSQSMTLLDSVMAETIGMTMYNAVSTQHNAQMLNSAATTSTCAKILSVIGVKTDLAAIALNSATSQTSTPGPRPENADQRLGTGTDNTERGAAIEASASNQSGTEAWAPSTTSN